MSTDRTLRASDQERDEVVSQLSDHMAAGRLDLAEFEDRAASASTARTLADLDALLTDLPSLPVVLTKRPAQEPRRNRRSLRPVRDVATAPLRPYASWLLVGVACLLAWAAVSLSSGTLEYFWPGWVIGPWGLALLKRRRHHSAWCGSR